jgi:site-specific recombinase XerD
MYMKNKEPRLPEFKRLLERYTQRKTDEGLSAERIKHLTAMASEVLAFLENREVLSVEEIGQEHLEAFMFRLRQRPHPRRAGGLSASYINKYRSSINSLMAFVLDVETSPFYLPSIRDTPLDPKKVPTVAQVQRLFNSCGDGLLGDRDRALLALLYGCGLRRGEAHSLDIGDVDFARGSVWVRRSKTGAQRLVPLSAGTKVHLERYRFRARPLLAAHDRIENAFLVSAHGARLSKVGVAHRVKELGREAGLKGITAHGLRHAIATHLVESLPLEDIARFLGHTSLDSTQKYTHVHQLQAESLRNQNMNNG